MYVPFSGAFVVKSFKKSGGNEFFAEVCSTDIALCLLAVKGRGMGNLKGRVSGIRYVTNDSCPHMTIL